jgi:hypothetical protein
MAKKKRRGEGKSTYFRKIYEANPSLIDRSNSELFDMWRKDNNLAPDAVIPKDIKAALANAKMAFKSKARGASGGVRNVKVKVASAVRGTKSLEVIEELIDNCISRVRALESPAFEHVVGLLVQARRQVIWKMGQ